VAKKPSYDELLQRVRDLEAESAEHEKAKLALHNSEAKCRAIVDAFDGLIYVCSQDYRVEFVNERMAERTGRDPLGELCYEVLHDRDSVCPWCVNERVFQGETVRWELQSPKDNRWYYVINTPICHADGRLSKQAMIWDITDRKRMEELLAREGVILEMVATGRPLQETLDRLNLTIEKLAPGTLCSILLLDETGKRLYNGSAPSLPREYIEGINGLYVGPSAGSCGTAVYRGETVIVEDTANDPLWAKGRDLVHRFGLRACWSVPIRNSTGRVVGTFALYDRQTRGPSKEDVELVETAAHLAGIAIDRHHSERALRESEEKYRSLFENSGDAIYMTTREGRFLDVNQSGVDLFGHSKEHMLNEMSVSQTYVDPHDRDKFREEVERKGSVRNFEVRLRKKDGTEMDCLLTSSVSRSNGGAVLGYQGIVRDITERKRAEKTLLESEARYRAVVEDQTELICRFLPGGILTFVNEAYCRYFGRSREELIGSSFMPLIPPEDHAKVESHLASLSPANPLASHEHRVITSNGEIRWQKWTNRMILDSQGRFIGFQSVGHDITERKLIMEALQKSAEKIKLFAYSVSHDLKSPAVGIHGLTRLLHNRYRDMLDERGRKYCDQILKTSEQIVALVDEINVYISTKQAPLNLELVNVKEILHTLKHEFSTRLRSRRISWIEPDSTPEIKGDRLSILRVLRNFVDNALKHGGGRLSKIKLDYHESDEFHTLSVTDDGVGIDKESTASIFDPFQRQDKSGKVEGMGLGLAIVKEIADQHGGSVWVDLPVEGGTKFSFSISKRL
jgi:PAS domain S-box-containing protein